MALWSGGRRNADSVARVLRNLAEKAELTLTDINAARDGCALHVSNPILRTRLVASLAQAGVRLAQGDAEGARRSLEDAAGVAVSHRQPRESTHLKVYLASASALIGGGSIILWIWSDPAVSISQGLAAGLTVGIAALAVVATILDSRDRESFTDVDARRAPLRSAELQRMVEEAVSARLAADAEQGPPPQAIAASPPASPYATYFDELKRVLEDKAAAADEKASLLLDKGVSYSRWGIVFYVVSIIAWQALAWEKGFQTQFIYGIASCSLLFVFIEFLAAWFLKQYRAFVDTSTYLMKVKSIFDRYMLTYLAQGDERISAQDSPAAVALFQMLGAEIKWPESYLGREPDANLGREFVTSLSELAAAAKRPNGAK